MHMTTLASRLKKGAVLLLSISLLLGMAACGGSGTPGSSAESPVTLAGGVEDIQADSSNAAASEAPSLQAVAPAETTQAETSADPQVPETVPASEAPAGETAAPETIASESTAVEVEETLASESPASHTEESLESETATGTAEAIEGESAHAGETIAHAVEGETLSDAPETEGPAEEELFALPTVAAEDANATLYIGSECYFRELPVFIEGDVTAEAIIVKMAELTNWNLDLASPIVTGKGGATVLFAKTSSLYTGIPENQVQGFVVYDRVQLIDAILGSVKATLQHYYVTEEGDPASVSIWYAAAEDEPLSFPDLGLTIPMDAPYEGL
ncbi:MAG: hypothetical protein IJ773_05975 [Lachnospiraceae bacterium]|nr:hypothetical protein [Lachnospiraceae bacterium]